MEDMALIETSNGVVNTETGKIFPKCNNLNIKWIDRERERGWCLSMGL